jgi:hypothetical protein
MVIDGMPEPAGVAFVPDKRPDTVGEPPLLVFNDPNRGSCVGATRRSAVDGVVEVPCRGLRLMIASFRVKYYIKYFL